MGLPSAILQRGTRASQPAATAVAAGTVYCVSDEGNILERSTGAAWTAFSPTGSGSGTVTHTAGALTASAVMVGNGSDDAKVLASLGTTTTVLHGNAAGLPTFGAVALASDVSGDLPFANLTQIAGLSVLGVTGSSTADVAAITAGTDGHVLQRVSSSSMTFAAPPVASSVSQGQTADITLTVADTRTDVTGATLTLAAGTWILFANFTVSCSTTAYFIGLIADSANVNYASVATSLLNGYMSGSVPPTLVTIGGSTTFKLRAQSGSTAAVVRKLDNGSYAVATGIAAIRVA
jgi:hypothetical protein